MHMMIPKILPLFYIVAATLLLVKFISAEFMINSQQNSNAMWSNTNEIRLEGRPYISSLSLQADPETMPQNLWGPMITTPQYSPPTDWEMQAGRLTGSVQSTYNCPPNENNCQAMPPNSVKVFLCFFK